MMTAPLLSPLLLALAAGMAAPAHATADNPTSLPPQACQSVRAELDAVASHLREARADRAGPASAPDPYQTLAHELESHLDTLHASLPTQATQATQRAQASALVSDALVLVRGATHLEARQLAVQRLDDDQRLYNRVLETLGCSATRPTAL
jgi:hypothetical protein